MRNILFLLVLVAVVAAQCPSGWNNYEPGAWCYLHVMGGDVTRAEAEEECLEYGAHLAAINTQEENEYLRKFTSFGEAQPLSQQPWIGVSKEGGSWKSQDGSSGIGYKWPSSGNTASGNCALYCPDPPLGSDDKKLHGAESGILVATDCNSLSNRYICRKRSSAGAPGPKPAVCDTYAERTTPIDCACKSGSVDVLNTNIPINVTLKKGERCVPSRPCASAAPYSLLFVMDASGKVGRQRFGEIASLLEKAAPIIAKSTRVGFIRYSTYVTKNFWLHRGWTEQDFLQYIPREPEPGVSCTFLALQHAAMMFKGDPNSRKIIVLFTDLININAIQWNWDLFDEEKQIAQKMMNDAGARLLVVGYGAGLITRYSTGGKTNEMVKLVEDKQEDFFPYYKADGKLSDIHMSYLLRRTCEM